MRKVKAVFKWGAAVLLFAVFFAAVWLYLWPLELFRVGSGYTAKIICSNVFIAGRDPRQVLADDVQAPGHPLLKLMDVSVDRETRSVRAALLGFFGERVAVARNGLGCTLLPDEKSGRRSIQRERWLPLRSARRLRHGRKAIRSTLETTRQSPRSSTIRQ